MVLKQTTQEGAREAPGESVSVPGKSSDETESPIVKEAKIILAAREAKLEAEQVLNNELPFLVPEEETEVFILEKTDAIQGYYGKWKNTHFILLKNTYDETQNVNFHRSSSQRLTHELTHQWLVEKTGMEDVMGKPVAEFLESSEVQGMSEREVIERIDSMYKDGQCEVPEFQFALAETIAFLAEQYLEYDPRTYRERFEQQPDVYPDFVKKMVIHYSESVGGKEELRDLLEEICRVVETKYNILSGDKDLQKRILNDPQLLLDFDTS